MLVSSSPWENMKLGHLGICEREFTVWGQKSGWATLLQEIYCTRYTSYTTRDTLHILQEIKAKRIIQMTNSIGTVFLQGKVFHMQIPSKRSQERLLSLRHKFRKICMKSGQTELGYFSFVWEKLLHNLLVMEAQFYIRPGDIKSAALCPKKFSKKNL